MNYERTLEFAQEADKNDPLKDFRKEFLIPHYNNKEIIYLCGNSLGLQPRSTRVYLEEQLRIWEELAVEGHFKSETPWMYYQRLVNPGLCKLTGGRPAEVVAMNNLTVNLHLMMVSFYRPTAERYKIIVEGGAFPSDQYAVESQAIHHGLDPEKVIIELLPRPGEYNLRTTDILDTIEKHRDSLALVLLGGVNYYTGQFFDLEQITAKAHECGAYAGFDLAHTIGNIPLELHKWNVDFGVWCSYKYLNSSPGGVAGAFIHERHGNNPAIPRFAGWWGYEETTRFQMKKGFKPQPGAEGWQLSNVPILAVTAHRAALELFDRAGMQTLREKSKKLTAYLEFLIEEVNKETGTEMFKIITPADKDSRGCQLSVICKQNGRQIFDRLTENGIMGDWREPEVLRFSPVPLYNSFEDLYHFGTALSKIAKQYTEPVHG